MIIRGRNGIIWDLRRIFEKSRVIKASSASTDLKKTHFKTALGPVKNVLQSMFLKKSHLTNVLSSFKDVR